MPQKNNSLSAVEKRAIYVCFDDYSLFIKLGHNGKIGKRKDYGKYIYQEIRKFLIRLHKFTTN